MSLSHEVNDLEQQIAARIERIKNMPRSKGLREGRKLVLELEKEEAKLKQETELLKTKRDRLDEEIQMLNTQIDIMEGRVVVSDGHHRAEGVK